MPLATVLLWVALLWSQWWGAGMLGVKGTGMYGVEVKGMLNLIWVLALQS